MAKAQYSAAVNASGDATVTVRTNAPVPWTVSQVTIEMNDAPAGAVANLRHNGYLVSPMIPTADVASGEPYVTLLPTDTMTVEWENCTTGDIGKVLVLYREGA